MKRIAITGSSGYLGSKLVEYYRSADADVIGIDVVKPKSSGLSRPTLFHQLDICDSSICEVLEKGEFDAVIHAAFVFTPIRNKQKMQRINVDGTRNVISAIKKTTSTKLCVVSSATAYGAWPDNPVPMDESWPIRARKEFQYLHDKGTVESLLVEFASENPKINVSWVRPAIIGGPNFDNYLRRFVFGMPFLVLSDGHDTPVQFVHENDVVSAIDTILSNGGTGAYNVGPDDWTSIKEVAELTGRRTLRWPFWLTKFVHGFAWFIRFPLHESPPGFLYYARYPWVVSSKRLQDELSFEFQHSNRETLLEIIESEKG